VDSYVAGVKKLAKAIAVGEQLRYAIQRGLRPQLLAHVIQAQPTTVDDLVKSARVAEAASMATATTSIPRFGSIGWTVSSQSWQQTGSLRNKTRWN